MSLPNRARPTVSTMPAAWWRRPQAHVESSTGWIGERWISEATFVGWLSESLFDHRPAGHQPGARAARLPTGSHAGVMKLYADLPTRRTLQIAGDLIVVGWIVLWAVLGHAVHDATVQLADPGRRVTSASVDLADRLHDSGQVVGDLPLVGEAAAQPFDQAGDAAERLADAGRSQVRAAERLARWIGWSVALIPILGALLLYLPPRVRFVRRAAAGRALVDSAADLDLFALRALAHQPLSRLAAISDDPASAWRQKDAATIRRLAALELAAAGLRPESADR